MEERLLTSKEVSQILGISEDKVSELAQKGQIPAYKVGGTYLRFKREQIETLKDNFREKTLDKKFSVSERSDYTFFLKVKDFFYFYDFYILCSFIILLLSILIFKG